jgi:hypothetical protein
VRVSCKNTWRVGRTLGWGEAGSNYFVETVVGVSWEGGGGGGREGRGKRLTARGGMTATWEITASCRCTVEWSESARDKPWAVYFLVRRSISTLWFLGL